MDYSSLNEAAATGADPTPYVAAGLGIGLAVIAIAALSLLALYVYYSLCLMFIAQKLKVKNAWLAWIPILSLIPMLRAADKPMWWIILMFISPINMVIAILAWMEISKKLGKPDWWGVLIIIPVANLVIPGILAFSKSAQPGAKPKAKPAAEPANPA